MHVPSSLLVVMTCMHYLVLPCRVLYYHVLPYHVLPCHAGMSQVSHNRSVPSCVCVLNLLIKTQTQSQSSVSVFSLGTTDEWMGEWMDT